MAPPALRLPPALQTLLYLADPVGFLGHCARDLGPTFTVRTLMYGEQVFVSAPDDVGAVLAAPPETMRGGEANTVLRHVVGARSVSSLDGEEHRLRRRLLAPVFQAARVEQDTVAAATARALASLPPRRPVALRPVLRRLTLELMLRSTLGDPAAPGVRELGDLFAGMVDLGAIPFAQLGAIPALRRDLGPLSPWGAFARTLRRVDQGIHAQIARRRADPGDRDAPPRDLLGALLQARDEQGRGLDTQALRDDVFTILGAGYETTATALAWALEAILLRPALRARLARELAELPPDGPLPLLDATIRESLRLRPVLPTVSRLSTAPLRLGAHQLPARSGVVLCVYLTHRSAFADPDIFLPERFLGQKPDPHAWLPFGGGPRRCPGMGLALQQMRWALAAALSGFSLELAAPRPSYPVFRGSTLAPAGGLRATVARRG